MPRVVIPGIDVALLTGPLVLGYMWSYCLYGILIVQVYMYSEAYPRDRAGIKAVVWGMFILETVFTLFITIAAWNQYGLGWGDTDTLVIIDWAWEPLPALNGVLAGIAQSFYIWRIWSLTKQLWVPIIIGLVVLAQVTVAFYYGIVVSIEGRGVDKLFALTPEITFWLTSTAAADLFITLSLLWIFFRQKQRSNFARTSGIINRLIRYSVETGAITSLGAIVEVTLWLTSHQWNIHFIFFLVLGKLYSNMLLATLNARAPMFRGETSMTGSAPANSFWADGTVNSPPVSNVNLNSRGVHISRTVDVAKDVDPIAMDDFSPTGTNGRGVQGKSDW
ncbi:hypothetical protein C8F04DRAFT_1066721 [Mycena alexandri]|uniref:DUF6534 domain-containing protein n=1 Tax=Mycena alexandri TaxID=1745969 RepID=A0AAD6TJ47_9AGAR|nr:hypothetical protein C8F04DRAFT_1066721 [Mycena alexandri]